MLLGGRRQPTVGSLDNVVQHGTCGVAHVAGAATLALAVSREKWCLSRKCSGQLVGVRLVVVVICSSHVSTAAMNVVCVYVRLVLFTVQGRHSPRGVAGHVHGPRPLRLPLQEIRRIFTSM